MGDALVKASMRVSSRAMFFAASPVAKRSCTSVWPMPRILIVLRLTADIASFSILSAPGVGLADEFRFVSTRLFGMKAVVWRSYPTTIRVWPVCVADVEASTPSTVLWWKIRWVGVGVAQPHITTQQSKSGRR